jgi:hypothetical protein
MLLSLVVLYRLFGPATRGRIAIYSYMLPS